MTLRRWTAVAIWAAAIFLQSALPSVVDTSAGVGMDKIVHMAVYALLAVLLCRALSLSPMVRRSALSIVAAASLVAALYGVSDELHQALVPARCADVADGIADLVGSVLGAMLWAGRRRKSRI
jgi:VanZ family protein